MATIAVTPLTEGVVIPTTTINDNFRLFSEINGSLDAANLSGVVQAIRMEHLQPRSQSEMSQAAGNANLDYFNPVRYVFIRNTAGSHPVGMNSATIKYLDKLTKEESWASTALSQKGGLVRQDEGWTGVTDAATCSASIPTALPGASKSFYLPWRGYVLLTWQVCWGSDAARFGPTPTTEQEIDPDLFDEPNTAIRLFVDSAEHNMWSTTRETREAMFAHDVRMTDFTSGEEQDYTHKLRDRAKSRYWCGHAWVGPLTKGFHTASLRVVASKYVRQTRVRARNIKAICFRA